MGKTKRQRRNRRNQHPRSAPQAVASAPSQNSTTPTIPEKYRSLGPKDLFGFYSAGQYDELSKGLLVILGQFGKGKYTDINPHEQAMIDAFAQCLLDLFTRNDYVISPCFQETFVVLLPAITNLVAMSKFRTTDPQLEILLKQPNSLPKILPLYSARNRIRIDYEWLFAQDAKLTSLWYGRYFHATTSSRTQTMYENLRHHLQCMDDRYEVYHPISTKPIFYSTYIDDRVDRFVRERINTAIRHTLAHVPFRNKPNPRSIALFTSFWAPKTSICRGLRPFVDAIADRYDLTLVHLGKEREDVDARGFRDVKRVWVERDGKVKADSLKDNDFQMVYYADVGMTFASVYLSNLRIAPIQVTSYGHPTSTWGSQIDYFLGGTELEAPTDPHKDYYERLVLIPGGAVFPTIPSYQPTRPHRPTSQIVINCVWNTGKCNWPMLMILKKILREAGKKVLFQFLPTVPSLPLNGFVPYKMDVESEMGIENVCVLATKLDGYMSALETGHFSIDSYPFGSFTGVVDALHVGIPMVTWEGNRAYNRSAARLNRKAGLEELIAHNEDEYVEKTCRLIEDDEYRNALYARIRALDLKQALFDPKEVDYFVKAIDYLIENHEELQRDNSREPILISP